MNKVKIISADEDGADLRKEKVRNRYYSRCKGKADQEEINEAIQSVGADKYFFDSESWERIFGGKA